MFERPATGEKAILVQLDLGDGDFAERLAEFRLLVTSAGAQPLAVVSGRRQRPDPATFAGKGKVAEIGETARLHDADLVVFNHELAFGSSPCCIIEYRKSSYVGWMGNSCIGTSLGSK